MKTILQPLVCGILGFMLADNFAMAQSTNDAAGVLQSCDYAKRQLAIRELDAQRKEIIDKMVRILKGKHPDDVKQDAAKVLGIYRATEAVGALADNLELDISLRSIIRDSPVPSQDFFPVSLALERIGGASIPHLLNKLSITDSKLLRGRCLSVCLAIEGREHAETRLQKARDEAPTPEARRRLELALQALTDVLHGTNLKIKDD